MEVMLSVSVSSMDAAVIARDVLSVSGPRELLVSSSLPSSPVRKNTSRTPRFLTESRSLASPDGAEGGCASPVQPSPVQPMQSGSCYCGAVRMQVQGLPAVVSICHCSICRRLSGAPFVVSALFKPSAVEVASSGSGGVELLETRTSSAVVRQRCASCYSPVAALLGERFTAVPLAAFDWAGSPAPVSWQPKHHLHYASRVISVRDDLPKYVGCHGGKLWQETQETQAEATAAPDC